MNNKIIDSARERFDKELHSDMYKKVHGDSKHLNSLLDLCDAKDNNNILDLGTGNGYVAFELAKRNPNISVAGLDIAKVSIEQNNEIAKSENLNNIKFTSYDGMNLPYEDNSFDKIISRYTFHHFPDPENMIKQIYKKLTKKGLFILSDPMTYDLDTSLFVDNFQKLKKDGHVHCCYLDEITAMLAKNGLKITDIFFNEISFNRVLDKDYNSLLDNTSDEIKQEYKIQIKDDLVFITIKAFNLKIEKQGNIE